MSREILITGMGVVSPIGIGLDSFWESLAAGRSGVKVRPEFAETQLPFRLGATVDGFDAKQFVKPRKALKVMSLPIQFGYAASAMAAEQAQLKPGNYNPDRLGTVLGAQTFYAPPEEMVHVFRHCLNDHKFSFSQWGEIFRQQIQPLWMLQYLPNMVASHISIGLDARGPSNTICQGDSSSLLSIIEGAELIRRDWLDAAIVGGSGSQTMVTKMVYTGSPRLSHEINDPQRAVRPFALGRSGFVIGEGAGAICIESTESAQRRGAIPLAKLSGWCCRYCPLESPGFSEALSDTAEEAIRRAGLHPNDITHINAHGLGTLLEDRLESACIRRINSECPVVALKSYFGNLGPAGGSIELIASILTFHNALIPATLNCHPMDPECNVRVSSRPVATAQRHVLKLSFDAEGQQAAVVVSAV